MTDNNFLVACGTALLLAILGGVFALAWHGSVSGGDAITVAGGIVAIAGTAFAVHSGVNAGAKAANAPTTDMTKARLPE